MSSAPGANLVYLASRPPTDCRHGARNTAALALPLVDLATKSSTETAGPFLYSVALAYLRLAFRLLRLYEPFNRAATLAASSGSACA